MGNEIQIRTGDLVVMARDKADQRDHLFARLAWMHRVNALPDCRRLFELWDGLPPDARTRPTLFSVALTFANLRLHRGYAWLPDELLRYWALHRVAARRGTKIVVRHELVPREDLPAGKGHGKSKASHEVTLAKYVEWHFRKTVGRVNPESWHSICAWDDAGLRRLDEDGKKTLLQKQWVQRGVKEVERLLRLGYMVAGHISQEGDEA